MILPKITLLPIGSTVAVEREDSDRWTHGTIVGMGDYNHNNQSYIIRVIKSGRTISSNSKHVKATPIMCHTTNFQSHN